MITREQLKEEINNVQDEYIIPLYKIIKIFEYPEDANEFDSVSDKGEQAKEDWYRFVDRFAGCLADTPIERGNQGEFELREELG